MSLFVAIIGAFVVGLSPLEPELGNRLGVKTGSNGEIQGRAVPIGVGSAVAAELI